MELNGKTTSTRCDLEINDTKQRVIIDTGAAANIITQALLDKLGLKIQKSSKAQFTIANGEKAPSLGKVQLELGIQSWIIPITAEVIDAKNKNLVIIGTKTLSEQGTIINFENDTIVWRIEDEKVKIPMYYTQKELIIKEEYSPESEDESENSDNN